MRARHNLVWLSEAGWQAALQQAAPDCRAAVQQWRRHDWPAVVRRTEPMCGDHDICIGIPLPPDASGSKIRIPLTVPQSAVSRWSEPMAIAAAQSAVPKAWRAPLSALTRQAEQQGLSIRVFGSVALQALTRQNYLTAASDIDLLFAPASVAELNAGMELLVYFAGRLPLDGEIAFPFNQAVAWKEWLVSEKTACRLLVKGDKCVSMRTRASLLAALERPPCMMMQ